MDLFSVLTLVGGLAIFLYGMSAMGQSLEKMAGGKLERTMERLTSSTAKSVLLGAGVTSVIQSSSATTVMVVGFVNSGLMKLKQAVGVIMGANIGTTITAWILSLAGIESSNIFVKLLKPSSFSPIFAIVGVILFMFSKVGRRRDTGMIFVGFALLMFGMDTMTDAVKPLTQNESFKQLFVLFKNPLFGVLAGAVLTAVVQSSSSSVGILQALAVSGGVTFGAAVPIICGQNIGTCINAVMSGIGANKNAKRASLIHLLFNLLGTAIFLILYYSVTAIFDISVGGRAIADMQVGALEIALVHTGFNICATSVLLPCRNLLLKLVCRMVKGDDEEQEFKILDDRFLNTPSFALEHCRRLTEDMARTSCDAMQKAIDAYYAYDVQLDREVRTMEGKVDVYEDKLGSYLVRLGGRGMSVSDSREKTRLLHMIGDLERISDHAVNVIAAAEEMHNDKIEFSVDAQGELAVATDALMAIMQMSVDAFINEDLETASKIEPLSEVIGLLCDDLKARHVQRLNQGRCTIKFGFVFNDLLNNFERVSDHCSNIAVCLLQTAPAADGELGGHGYIEKLRHTGEFDRVKEEYINKYFSLLDK